MRDRVTTAGTHDYALHFHFAPDGEPEIETHPEGARLAVRAAEGNMENEAAPWLQVYTFAGVEDGEWHEREGWVSDCYGARTPAPVRTFATTATGAQDFITFLIPPPAANGMGATRVLELEATGGRSFEIECGTSRRREVLLVGDGSYVESAGLASDFEWSWVRFSHDGAQLEELVLIGGRRLSLHGQEIVGLPARVSYVVARRVGDQLLIETDAGHKSVAPGGLLAARADLEEETDGRLVSPLVERR
jgi:hypothetical protein